MTYTNKAPFNFSLSLQTPSMPENPQVSKHLFTTKWPLSRRDYTELEIFRQQIEENQEGLHHQPYTANRSTVRLYKAIFFGFAFLFAFLGLFVVMMTSSLAYSFLNYSFVFKSLVATFCGTLALAALTLAMTMRAERETIRHYVRLARSNLAKVYARKRMNLGFKTYLFNFGKNQKQAAALRQMYHDACDKIHERKEEVLHLVNRIAGTQSLDSKTKELLFNQAICELNDKLTLLTHTFKHSALPHFS